jgi:acetyl esterase/lipase
MTVPIIEGETMYAALVKAGVAASFVRIEGAGHGFEGADLERVNAAMAAALRVTRCARADRAADTERRQA